MDSSLALVGLKNQDETISSSFFIKLDSTCSVQSISGTSMARNSGVIRTVSRAVTARFWTHFPTPAATLSLSPSLSNVKIDALLLKFPHENVLELED